MDSQVRQAGLSGKVLSEPRLETVRRYAGRASGERTPQKVLSTQTPRPSRLARPAAVGAAVPKGPGAEVKAGPP